MYKKNIFLCALFLIVFAACGTAPEDPTPVPTEIPIPTPIPYNLNVKIIDGGGIPISGATVKVNENSLETNADGQASFTDLSGENVSVIVNAPGYKAAEVTQTLTQGDNTSEVALEEDPNGLMLVNACAPDEKVLYVDDFQDGLAQKWDVVEGKAPGWSVEGDPDNPDDLVVAARQGVSWAWLGGRDTFSFDNSVWRLRFKYTGSGNSHINFRFVESSSQTSRYIIAVRQDDVRLGRLESDNHIDLGQAGKPTPGDWHLLEIGNYNGEVSVYLDGKKGVTWTDPNPWKGGTINLEPYPEGDAVFYYNNFSVCELSAPFAPIPRPKTGYNLAITVKDGEGNPIPSAIISLAEMGNIVTDSSGQAAWSDVPAGKAAVSVTAPGYKGLEESMPLTKGDNTVDYTLERDPSGKLVSELCRPDETFIYAEDFQAGKVNGWDEVKQKLELNIPGISILDEPELPGNKVLLFTGQNDGEHTEAGRINNEYGDAVLRYNFKMVGDIHQHLAWHWKPDNSEGYIAFIYGSKQQGGRLEKCAAPSGGPCQWVQVGQWNLYVGDGKWHTGEISFYQGEIQFWVDGKKLVQWTDPQSFPEGRWGLGHDFWKADATASYDNFAICGLQAPFVSILGK